MSHLKPSPHQPNSPIVQIRISGLREVEQQTLGHKSEAEFGHMPDGLFPKPISPSPSSRRELRDWEDRTRAQ